MFPVGWRGPLCGGDGRVLSLYRAQDQHPCGYVRVCGRRNFDGSALRAQWTMLLMLIGIALQSYFAGRYNIAIQPDGTGGCRRVAIQDFIQNTPGACWATAAAGTAARGLGRPWFWAACRRWGRCRPAGGWRSRRGRWAFGRHRCLAAEGPTGGSRAATTEEAQQALEYFE